MSNLRRFIVETLKVVHRSPRHFFDIEEEPPVHAQSNSDESRHEGWHRSVTRALESHGAKFHDGHHAFEVHPSRVASLKKTLTGLGIKHKHWTDE